jgi:hypothetical protein
MRTREGDSEQLLIQMLWGDLQHYAVIRREREREREVRRDTERETETETDLSFFFFLPPVWPTALSFFLLCLTISKET